MLPISKPPMCTKWEEMWRSKGRFLTGETETQRERDEEQKKIGEECKREIRGVRV